MRDYKFNSCSMKLIQEGKQKKIPAKAVQLWNETIIVSGGMIDCIKDLLIDDTTLVSVSNDPQIIVRFQKPVEGIKVNWEIGNDIPLEKVNIYYNTVSQSAGEYLEEKKCQVYYTESLLCFEEKVREIRIDPMECEGRIERKSVFLEGIESVSQNTKNYYNICENKVDKDIFVKKVVVLTHDMDESGAPILAFNIAKCFKEKGYSVVVLTRIMREGFLNGRFQNNGIPVISLEYEKSLNKVNYICSREKQKEYYLSDVLGWLVSYGYKQIITNTIVSGECVWELKSKGMKVISLIHEMKRTIEIYNFEEFGKNIAELSDCVVFPDEIVMKDFKDICGNISNESYIKPQGVYFQTGENKAYEGDVLSEYNIPSKSKVVLGSGTVILRKGIDLFLSAAQILRNIEDDEEYHFVWTGDFKNNSELLMWLQDQVIRSDMENRIHFIQFIDNKDKYRCLLNRADVFWNTSREDPFPSVVIEAMSEGLPVFAFRNSGGVNTLLSEGRGWLINNFNVYELASLTKDLLTDKELADDAIMKAKEYVTNELDFEEYITFLQELLIKEES